MQTPITGNCEAPHEFLFTKDGDRDYSFIVGGRLSEEVQQHIALLQDYFPVLINGVGYYSFPFRNRWITARASRTHETDSFGRAIYAISGQVIKLEHLASAWHDFVTAPAIVGSDEWSFDGAYEPSRQLTRFLQHCRHLSEPVSWAYGAFSEEDDTSGLDFEQRFVVVDVHRPSFWQRARNVFRLSLGSRY